MSGSPEPQFFIGEQVSNLIDLGIVTHNCYPMKRNLKLLSEKEFDVVIIGGGIYGAALIREAALRGLSAAMVDKGDFCCATSANSLKIIHGGLRYLQQADLIRVRESVRERRAMLRIAPHLIRPLPCLMPTTGVMKSIPTMFAGIVANEILSIDRNRGVILQKRIPAAKIISRSTLDKLVQKYPLKGTGAALWTDAVADNSERIVVEMIMSATEAGAVAANYVEMTDFLKDGDKVTGIKVHDKIDGDDFEIKSKLVINAVGPWSNKVLEKLDGSVKPLSYSLALGMNAILKEELIPTYAAGVPCQEEGPDKGRLMFIVPWQGTTMGGTFYRHFTEDLNNLEPSEYDIERLVRQLNSALPNAEIKPEDITRIHAGVLPCKPGRPPESDPKLLGHYKLVDHTQADGIQGLMTVLGVKYTTARDVAERSINLAAKKLNKTIKKSNTATIPLPASQTKKEKDSLEIINNAINHEMAQTLSDIIYRRSNFGSKGAPPSDKLQQYADIAAKILGWSNETIQTEIAKTQNPLAS